MSQITIPECTHTVAVFASTNRKQTITGMGVIVHELKEGRISSKRIFQYSETYRHSRWAEAQPVAVIRALEVALEHGYVCVRLCSNYYHSQKRLHGYSRSDPWSPEVQAKFKELAKAFTTLQFGALGQREASVRALARRAARSGNVVPLRERAPYLSVDLDLHLDVDEVELDFDADEEDFSEDMWARDFW